MSESKNSPFDSPLRNAQWLNVYGNFKNVPEHMAAVIELLRLRGGVENLKLYGLAEILVVIVRSSHFLALYSYN